MWSSPEVSKPWLMNQDPPTVTIPLPTKTLSSSTGHASAFHPWIDLPFFFTVKEPEWPNYIKLPEPSLDIQNATLNAFKILLKLVKHHPKQQEQPSGSDFLGHLCRAGFVKGLFNPYSAGVASPFWRPEVAEIYWSFINISTVYKPHILPVAICSPFLIHCVNSWLVISLLS